MNEEEAEYVHAPQRQSWRQLAQLVSTHPHHTPLRGSVCTCQAVHSQLMRQSQHSKRHSSRHMAQQEAQQQVAQRQHAAGGAAYFFLVCPKSAVESMPGDMTRSGDLLSAGTEADLGTVLCSADAPFMRTESLVCSVSIAAFVRTVAISSSSLRASSAWVGHPEPRLTMACC